MMANRHIQTIYHIIHIYFTESVSKSNCLGRHDKLQYEQQIRVNLFVWPVPMLMYALELCAHNKPIVIILVLVEFMRSQQAHMQ